MCTIVVTPCRDNVASLTLLADMTAQAKAIEILISHVHEVRIQLSVNYVQYVALSCKKYIHIIYALVP